MTKNIQLPPRNDYTDEKGRLYFYDNAKFILIFFVVLAHAISPIKSTAEYLQTAWTVINTLHMPCLIFISGFFAKRYIRPGKGINVQRIFSYVLIYSTAQLSISMFERYVLKVPFSLSFLSARTSLWFLQCLIVWYLFIPVLDKFNPKLVLPATFIFGLLIGYDNSAANVLALSRVFVHLPFFMLGYYCQQNTVEKAFTAKVRIPALALSAAIILLVYKFNDYIPSKIITCNNAYSKINYNGIVLDKFIQGGPRALFYICALILIVGFFSVVPRKKTFFTRFGSKTLAVYILHRFLYLAMLEYNWGNYFKNTWGAAALFAIAVALTFILSTKPFTYVFDKMQSVKADKLLKKQPEGEQTYATK